MKSAVIYARYSSNSQTEQSIEGQLTVCEKYARDNNLLIVNTYIDRAMTGTNDNRAAFQQMLSDSKNAPWVIVLVYAIDRFGRNSTEVILNKKKLTDNGKILISATQRTSENIDGTKNLDGILLENVYIGLAAYYSAELSQKVCRGQEENRKKGLFCGGTLPYGYYIDNKKVFIDEERAKVVEYIFTQYSIGIFVPQIIKNLTEQGIRNKGEPLKPTMVYGILRNEKYTGIYRLRDQIYTNIYPKIIEPELFETVKNMTAKHVIGKHGGKTIYLLKDKAKCGYCGRPFSAECGTSKNGRSVHYYKCQGRKKRLTECAKTSVRKDDFEDFIINTLIDTLSTPNVMEDLIDGVMKTQEEILQANTKIKSLEKDLRNTEMSLNNLVAALERGVISNTTNKRIHELETRMAELEETISIEKCKTVICLNETQIKTFYEKALKQEAQALIGTLIKEIIVFDDKIEIFLNTPIRKDPDESRDFSFYKGISLFPVITEKKKEPYLYEMEIEMFVS